MAANAADPATMDASTAAVPAADDAADAGEAAALKKSGSANESTAELDDVALWDGEEYATQEAFDLVTYVGNGLRLRLF